MQNWSISSEICSENSYEIGSFLLIVFFGKVSSENFSEIPVKSANFSCVNPNVFPCPKRTVLVSFHLGLQIKVSQYTATSYILITTETTEHHGNFDLFYFQYNRMWPDNMTGKMKGWPVNSPISSDIVRWPSPTDTKQTCAEPLYLAFSRGLLSLCTLHNSSTKT